MTAKELIAPTTAAGSHCRTVTVRSAVRQETEKMHILAKHDVCRTVVKDQELHLRKKYK
jgi:hypothetical protein